MQKVKIVIVEDELLAAQSLKITLENLGYEVVAIFNSGDEAVRDFRAGMADVFFMDIHLANSMNGLEAASAIGKISNVPIIFLTQNHDEQLQKEAINKANTVHYINKPFSQIDISVAVDFALKSLKSNGFLAQGPKANAYLLNDSIFLKNPNGFNKIMIADIKYITAEGSYSMFYFRNLKEQILCENLSYFEEKLSFAKDLLRVHRSFIVNVNHIGKVQENRLWIDETEIPIGKTYRSQFAEKFRFIQ